MAEEPVQRQRDPQLSRDPFRPLIGAVTCAFFYFAVLYTIVPVGRFLGGEMIAITVPPLVAAAISGALAMAVFESRAFGELGLAWRNGSAHNLLSGMALGAAAATLVVMPAMLLGLAHFEWIRSPEFSWRATLFAPLLLFCGAMGEEIAFRGFILQYLMRGYGRWAAIFGVGALFGALHGFNPGATTLGIVNTALFGILFGAAILRSHDLWLPIGMHFGWNALLPFLGVDLSGLTIRVTEYKVVWKAGILWSGGEYGPEASVLTSAVLVLLAFAVWKMPVRKGGIWLFDESSADSAA